MRNSFIRWDRDFIKTVARLAWPIMVQSLVTALMHMLDNVMIGRLGETEFAGVTQADRVIFLLIIIMFGLISGNSIFTSQFWGTRDIRGIHKMMALSLMMALGISLVFAIPSLISPEGIMRLLIKDPAAIASGARYLRAMSAVFIVQALVMVEESILKSTEHVKLPMVAGLVAILTSTVANYVLIFGKFGFPRLGVLGGAYGTLIGVGIQLSILLVVGYRRGCPNAILPRDLRLPDREVIGRYFKTVAPVLLNETFWSLGVVMYSVAYGRMGTGPVAAVSILSNVEQLTFIALRGVTTACAVLLGKSIGAGRMDEAQVYAKRFLVMNIAITMAVGLLVVLFAGNITLLFNVAPATRESAGRLILYFGMFAWLTAGNNTLVVGIMRAGGDVVFSGILDVVFLWGLSVPLVHYFGPHMGWPIESVYLLIQVEGISKFVVCLVRVLSGKWRNNLVADIQNMRIGEASND